MTDTPRPSTPTPSLGSLIEEVCLRFEDAWIAGQRPSLELYLGEVAPDGRAELLRELLKLELYYRHRAGERPAVDEYGPRFPGDVESIREVFADAATGPEPEASDSDVTDPARLVATGTPRYVPQRLHAKGGLGEVHVAQDVDLRRNVALKRIQHRWAKSAESRRRFLAEAEITGRLEHPGVVPVYGLVHDRDGEPCYAMRFIEGETFEDAVRRFHAGSASPERQRRDEEPVAGAPGWPAFSSLVFRNLLQRFVAVCNTIAYAHSKGVLHRDLKPSNVMLGQYGETQIIDWGLAKSSERDAAAPAAGAEATPSALSAGATPPGSVAGTRPGHVLGTPAYMSPEQARGESDRLGPATDIFGLGALLYVLLTGRAPYGGGSVVELLDRARRSEYAPPRSVRGGISPALEAICRKAMTAKPEDRYPSALDLAADVERWLADEPVAAFREPFSVRARRWVRKHARLATGAAVALVVGLASVGAIAWQREHALITTRVQKQRTREALDTMLSKEMIERLGTQKELTAGQRAFFQKALAYYREFADEAATDEEGRKLVADAHSRVGSLLTKLGAKADAEAAFSSAYLAYERLADRDAGEPEYRRLAGGCLNDLAIVRGELRKLQDAEAAARDAIALFTSLADKYPDNPAYRHDLARSHSNLGQVFAAVRKFAEAETEVRKCYSLQVELVEKFPHDRDLQRELAGCRNNLGLLTMEAGKFAAAEDLFRAALAHMSTETDLIRDDPDFRSQLARTQKSLGFLLEANGKHADAAAAYRDSIVHRQELVARYPGLREYAVDLGSSFNALGNMLNDKGDHAAAIECFRQAIAAVDPVVAKEPGLPGAREELCGSYGGRAASHTLLQQYADALTDWDRAEPLADGLKRDLVRLGRAETFARLGRTAEAVAIADKVLDANGAPPLLFTASCVYAAASTAEPSGAVGVKAVATLRRAFMNGAPIMPSLYACPGLASLRGRDDYAALLWDLADGVPAPPK